MNKERKKNMKILKKVLTQVQEIFKFKQASKQASKQRKGGKLYFNLSSKELRGGCRLATEVAL